jgi:hypothetical protein
MAELGFRMLRDILFNLLPVILIVTDFLAVRTNRQEALELLDARQGFFEGVDPIG